METTNKISLFFLSVPVKLISLLFISFLLFLSFKISIFYSEEKLMYLLIFLFFEFLIIFFLFLKNLYITNFAIIICLNFLLTPIFFEIQFDPPYRQANTENIILWEKNAEKGFLKTQHKITTDSKGNRVNKKINYRKKPDETLRILAFGGSTTEQSGLENNLIWSNTLIGLVKDYRMQNKENYEMINFGISGTRSIHHYFTFKRNLELNPDRVIFLLGVNDWNYHIININEKFIFPNLEIAFDYRTSILHKVSSKLISLVKRKVLTKKPPKINLKKKNSVNPVKDIIQKNIDLKNNIKNYTKLDLKEVSPRYKYWLNKIIKTCEKHNIKCIFADQPSLYNISQKNNKNKLWMNPTYKDYKISFKEMVETKDIYNLFLEKKIKEKNLKFCKLSDKIVSNEIFFVDDVHFTPKGSKAVAKNFFKCIKS
jgi:lysophospholipase L1-like esterase